MQIRISENKGFNMNTTINKEEKEEIKDNINSENKELKVQKEVMACTKEDLVKAVQPLEKIQRYYHILSTYLSLLKEYNVGDVERFDDYFLDVAIIREFNEHVKEAKSRNLEKEDLKKEMLEKITAAGTGLTASSFENTASELRKLLFLNALNKKNYEPISVELDEKRIDKGNMLVKYFSGFDSNKKGMFTIEILIEKEKKSKIKYEELNLESLKLFDIGLISKHLDEKGIKGYFINKTYEYLIKIEGGFRYISESYGFKDGKIVAHLDVFNVRKEPIPGKVDDTFIITFLEKMKENKVIADANYREYLFQENRLEDKVEIIIITDPIMINNASLAMYCYNLMHCHYTLVPKQND